LHTRSVNEDDLRTPTMKTLRDLRREYERRIVEMTLAQNGGNQRRAAAALGITQRGLQKAIARHQIVGTAPRAA
jgi:transcriptional regulator with GAF, ATPase, and Fis domain